MVSLQISASFSYTLSINQCFMPPTTNLTPLLVSKRAARWVGFGEHVGDALTHKLLDDDTKKILYRSAVRPYDSTHPNWHLVPDGGESSQTPKPIIFVRSRQDDSQSATKPMAEYNPDDLIGSVKNSSSRFFQISCSQGILNSSRLSCYLLLRLLVYMYLSQLMRTFTNYLKCIVISS